MNEQFENLNQALLSAMDTFADKVCFHVNRGKRYQAITYERFRRYALRLAHFFLENGITNGQRVAIIADNPLEWMVVYVAGLLAGGVVVPLRAWSPTEKVKVMLCESGARLAVIQGEIAAYFIEQAGRDLPDLQTVLVVGDVGDTHPPTVSITTILGKPISDDEEALIRQHAVSVAPTAPALIYYKSGTPKGALFDHRRRIAAMHSMAEWFHLNADDIAITTILSWNLATLDVTLHYFLSGIAHIVTGSKDDTTISQQLSPTVMLTSPSGFQDFYNQTMIEMEHLPAARKAVFQWALNVGKDYLEAGLSASKELRDAYARADLTFFSQIRAKLGGRLRRIYSTGASLPPEWAEFVEIIGITPLNVYSLTEAGGFPAISQPDAHRADSCGQVAPGFQMRIADDGEVLVRGPSVMCGYWQKPEETSRYIDADGWLHTGDLGRFDKDGFLSLTGHKQPVFSLSTGRNVMPTTIESELTESPLIDQAVIFGEGRPFVSALIVPDMPVIQSRISSDGSTTAHPAKPISPTDKQVHALITDVVADVNNTLDNWSRIQEFSILPERLSQQKGELTQSQKVCRDTVAEHYAPVIEAMYPSTIPINGQTVTHVQLEPSELHELLEKQDLLDAWMADAGIEFLFDLARRKQIDPPSMVNISDTVATIAQMQNEEKPLSTALIIGDPVHIARRLPESEIQLQRFDHIRRMRQIVTTLAKMVDGTVLGYVLDTHGYVRGVHKLLAEIPQDSENYLFGPQFRHHAAISQECDAVVFFVPAGGRQVRVFADGRLVGRYSNGNWSAESIAHIDKAIANLADQRDYNLALLRRVMRVAFEMSERNRGAIFVIGDAEYILDNSDPPEISAFASIKGTDIDRLDDREIINFAKQDGATIINKAGKFEGCMVLLRPNANTQAEIGPGKGARHSSAAKMSAEAGCLAITVSQDGPITIYESGQRILSL
ncbi:MAG: AMP-binding protein [Anaerolineae bacterium]|nr:AMP-binding protein [Anaerolineae bacterium]